MKFFILSLFIFSLASFAAEHPIALESISPRTKKSPRTQEGLRIMGTVDYEREVKDNQLKRETYSAPLEDDKSIKITCNYNKDSSCKYKVAILKNETKIKYNKVNAERDFNTLKLIHLKQNPNRPS